MWPAKLQGLLSGLYTQRTDTKQCAGAMGLCRRVPSLAYLGPSPPWKPLLFHCPSGLCPPADPTFASAPSELCGWEPTALPPASVSLCAQ